MTSQQRWTLTLTSLAALMMGLDALVVGTALNTIRTDLGTSIEALEWTVNAYTLSFAMLMLTASTVGDRIGRRRLLAAGLAVFTAASAACALSPDVSVLIAARAVQGAGAAMVMPAALALVGAAFGPAARGKAMGIFAGITGLGILGGPVVGGAVVQGVAWQWIFWLNVPIGVLLVPVICRRITESTGPAGKLDLIGLALSALGVLGLAWGLVRGNTAGWASPEVAGTLTGGAVAMAAFAAWELRAPAPMLPMRLFASRVFSAANLAGLLMTGAIFSAVFFFAQYLQAGLHESPLTSGLRLLPWTAALFVVAPIAGARINRFGERRLIVAGLLAQAAGLGWIGVASGGGYLMLVAPMMLAGVGASVAIPATQSAAFSAVPPQAIGAAAGIYNTMRQLGATFGIAVVSAVFAAHGSYTSTAAVSHGFTAAMLVAAAISALGALVGLAVTPRRREAKAPVPSRRQQEAPSPA